MEFLLNAPENVVFWTALALLLVLGLLELLTLLVGFSILAFLEDLLPEGDGGEGHGLDRFLGWLHVGKVPLLVSLIFFFAGFGLGGLLLQWFSWGVLGWFFPGWVVALPAFLVALPVVRTGGRVVGRLLPSDESEAVSVETFVGHVATIVTGTARFEFPAEARVVDTFGRGHFIMVAPERQGDEFPVGAQVLLVEKTGAFFRGVTAPPEYIVR